MPRRDSRRPGPDHPVLFTDASDIPTPVEPLLPRAADEMTAFGAVLSAAGAIDLAELNAQFIGRTVTVGGRRRSEGGSRSFDTLLDDGTAVMGLATAPSASRRLREALAARFLLISGTVRDHDGELHVLVDEAGDLRTLAREWGSRR